MIGSTVLMKIAQLRSYTISPGGPLRMPGGFCLVFVHIRIANQMLMLVSGRVARQGSYRMVISMKLAYNKKADYLGPTRFLFFPVPTTNLDSYICLCISF